MPNEAVTVVIATRNRRVGLCATLERLSALPEQPDIIVVDNASTDGTPAAVRRRFPHVELVVLGRNRGASARNVGVRRARTRYVALSDDDSWWEPGTLTRAVTLLDTTPRVGLVTGATLVGPLDTPDPLNAMLAASPLSRDGLPGPRVLGFLGCAAVTRREAYLASGGYFWLLFIGGEEELLAYDLTARRWPIVYCADIVVHHWPSPIRDASRRRRQELCNRVLVAWLRRPLPCAARATARLARAAARDRLARRALAETALRLPVALLRRRPLPAHVEADIRRLEAARAT
ncbi:MAG TPA: glycosyltransferase [Streptosporangiaceae bacterium]|jgi:GT2 family glycosyltransferase